MNMVIKKCVICGKEFKVKFFRKDTAKYCSNQCCGAFMKEFMKGRQHALGHKKSEKCKKEQSERMKKNTLNQRMEKRKNNGRWIIWKPNHPFATKKGHVRQSHLIVEQCIGRYLTRQEVIHHINRVKSDDRPVNLYLFVNHSEHMVYHNRKDKLMLKSNIN